MTRIHSITKSLAIWVFPNDHAPPHFHVLSPDSDVLIDMRTFEVIAGDYRRRELAAALAWAVEPENKAKLEGEWRRLNGKQD